jgi:predicted nucleotide-binding protein (sugar kinase/HSP70/actin superfamily)
MGNSHIPFKALFASLGAEVVVPPPSTRRTAALGSRHAPEFACFPLKMTLGNFIEAAELGADTAVMAGGVGPCRFGYYAQVQKVILQDLGRDLDLVVLEPPKLGWIHLAHQVSRLTGGRGAGALLRAVRLAWAKCNAVDEIERLARTSRPRQGERGAVTRAENAALDLLDRAESARQVQEALEAGRSLIARTVARRTAEMRVGIVGEIFMVLDGFSNMDLERRLGEMGVEVHRFLTMSGWVRANLLPKRYTPAEEREAVGLARPYLDHFVGGHGLESVGGARLYAREGLDGVIQVMPFTCMPEIVAESVLRTVSGDTGVPILTLSFDEHTAEAGLQTRLEAFVDLLRRRRRGAAGG